MQEIVFSEPDRYTIRSDKYEYGWMYIVRTDAQQDTIRTVNFEPERSGSF